MANCDFSWLGVSCSSPFQFGVGGRACRFESTLPGSRRHDVGVHSVAGDACRSQAGGYCTPRWSRDAVHIALWRWLVGDSSCHRRSVVGVWRCQGYGCHDVANRIEAEKSERPQFFLEAVSGAAFSFVEDPENPDWARLWEALRALASRAWIATHYALFCRRMVAASAEAAGR